MGLTKQGSAGSTRAIALRYALEEVTVFCVGQPVGAKFGWNNLAALLSATNRLAEADPLYRQVLRILAEFGHRTGHEHPHFRTAINNYAGLLVTMGLSEAEILARLRSTIEDEP
jgi:hypothetical protein